jgi:histidyl-tRNA synthetase
MNLRAVKGMKDILPDEISKWHRLESAFRQRVEGYGFREARFPIVEPTALFVRSIGETTDIVEKEMYTFTDRGDKSLTLRPEGTASSVRAFVQHSVQAREPVTKWYYVGPMYRRERPAKGRYRQFYQAGIEVFGDPGPFIDAEVIDMVVGFIASLGITEVEVLVNSIGDDDRAHFDGLQETLTILGTPYRVDGSLVRGLDYYTRTLFEVLGKGEGLGAQNALLGGGRYDQMVKSFGGPDTPAIGFAMGLERLLMAMPESEPDSHVDVFIVAAQAGVRGEATLLGRELRDAGLRVESDLRGGSLKSQLRRADKINTRIAMILGEEEVEEGVVQLKDLQNKTQDKVPRAEAAQRVHALLSE